MTVLYPFVESAGVDAHCPRSKQLSRPCLVTLSGPFEGDGEPFARLTITLARGSSLPVACYSASVSAPDASCRA